VHQSAPNIGALLLLMGHGPRILLRLTGLGGFQAQESESLVTHNFLGVLSCRSQPIKADGQTFGPCRAPGTTIAAAVPRLRTKPKLR
jgi:hypothetical protein